jgi:hypothetical protein
MLILYPLTKLKKKMALTVINKNLIVKFNFALKVGTGQYFLATFWLTRYVVELFCKFFIMDLRSASISPCFSAPIGGRNFTLLYYGTVWKPLATVNAHSKAPKRKNTFYKWFLD